MMHIVFLNEIGKKVDLNIDQMIKLVNMHTWAEKNKPRKDQMNATADKVMNIVS